VKAQERHFACRALNLSFCSIVSLSIYLSSRLLWRLDFFSVETFSEMHWERVGKGGAGVHSSRDQKAMQAGFFVFLLLLLLFYGNGPCRVFLWLTDGGEIFQLEPFSTLFFPSSLTWMSTKIYTTHILPADDSLCLPI
jgi:hypothetical protein